MTADFATLGTDRPTPHVLVVTLNRPEAANAFNTQMATDLYHLFGTFIVSPELTVVVLVD